MGALQHLAAGAQPAQQDEDREGSRRRAGARGRLGGGGRPRGGAQCIRGRAHDGGRRRLVVERQPGAAAPVRGRSGHPLGAVQHSPTCIEPDQQDEVWLMLLRDHSVFSKAEEESKSCKLFRLFTII
ncbi:hypothetical protein Cni_G21562 [Canna indica]|uniref:Uncharacterized protein n=1 Tax=Canna indica TaxID=4628 RepID=A0AAQ3QIT6_9LILI|nr:hypothetical protein Cni_G21562 [Canna indica]